MSECNCAGRQAIAETKAALETVRLYQEDERAQLLAEIERLKSGEPGAYSPHEKEASSFAVKRLHLMARVVQAGMKLLDDPDSKPRKAVLRRAINGLHRYLAEVPGTEGGWKDYRHEQVITALRWSGIEVQA